jgi:hypothetical protein
MSYLLLLGALVLLAASLKLWMVARGKNVWVRVGAAACVVSLSIVSIGLFMTFLFPHVMCGEYVFPPITAPGNAAIAQITEFDCGATSAFSTFVRVRSANTLFGHLGLTRWSTIFWVEHDPRLVSVTWTGPSELKIRYPVPFEDPKHWKCDSAWEDVKIKCESYAADQSALLPQLPEPNRWLW